MLLKASDLPGVGKRISFVTNEHKMIVIIAHHTGKKELFIFDDPEEDEAVISLMLTSEETRELGAQLLGVTYQPEAVDKMRSLRKAIVMEWLEIQKDSPLKGKSLKESDIGHLTGAVVLGIIRGDEIIPSPNFDEIILEGDTLLATGKREQIEALEQLCNPSS